MRLAVFTNQFPGPVCTFFARDMRGLIDAGVDIDVFAIYPLDETFWPYVPELLNEKILPRNKVHHLSLGECARTVSSWTFRNSGRFFVDTLSIGASAIRHGVEPLVKSSYVFPKAWTWGHQFRDQFDHVLAYWGNYAATCAYIFHRLNDKDIPFSLFLHASIDLYVSPIYMREKLSYADNIITCSNFNCQFLKKEFLDLWKNVAEKIYVHYHGLDFSAFPFGRGNGSGKKIIAVGRLDESKGFDVLLRAMKELSLRGVDCHLELVGDGKERNALTKLKHDLQLFDRVEFRGWVRPDEIPTLMRQATVLVHPSSKVGDGVPNVIKESMAVGTPIIGSRFAGIPELLGDGRFGVLVPPNDERALADAIQHIFQNDSLRDGYAIAARAYAVEKFDLWRNGKSLAEKLFSATKSVRANR